MMKGYKRDLSADDLWKLDKDRLTAFESVKLEKEWRKVAIK